MKKKYSNDLDFSDKYNTVPPFATTTVNQGIKLQHQAILRIFGKE